MDKKNNYINMYGSIKHGYKIHVKRMLERGERYTTYSGFWRRVKGKGWTMEKAIYTPARKSEKKGWLYNIIYSIKNLFKRDGRG